MAPKIFLTGATGFIGGEVLYTIHHAHPDWEWVCLVRSKDKGDKVTAAYPNVRLVYGDTDDVEIIEQEASTADVVIHTAGSDDHEPSARAIVRGLERRQSAGPSYYIHTSGAFILAEETVSTGRYGERFDKVYDDWDGIGQLTSLPDTAPHRPVDKIVLAADPGKVATAIVAPSVVYGQGRGPDKTRFPAFLEAFLRRGQVFAVGSGNNTWHNVHVQDLSRMYLLLAEAAVSGGGGAGWNDAGYYLAENGAYVHHEMLRLVARIAHERGFLADGGVEFLTPGESDEVSPWLKIMLGADSQGVAVRARKLLGWTPRMPSYEDEIASALQAEATRLGLER